MPHHAVHPGKILADELDAVGVSLTELARQIEVPPNRISQIIKGKRSITGDTAVRLAHWFRTTPEFWLGLQAAFDVDAARADIGSAIDRLQTSPARRTLAGGDARHHARVRREGPRR